MACQLEVMIICMGLPIGMVVGSFCSALRPIGTKASMGVIDGISVGHSCRRTRPIGMSVGMGVPNVMSDERSCSTE